MVCETWVQSQVMSYLRLLKWYLIPPCLTVSNIWCVSRVKWSNPGKGVAPSPIPRCSSYRKRSLLVALDYGRLYNQLICPMGSVRQWSRKPGFNHWSSHTKDFKNGTLTYLLNTRHYKVCIKGKVEQSRERSSALPYTFV